MATDDRVTQQNTTGQQEEQTLHDNPNVQPELSELDAEQAFLWLLQLVIDASCLVGAILVQSAMDAGKPEMAKQIRREFPELLKSKLPDTLRQVWDEFRQLWLQLQPIFCEIKDHGLKAIDFHWTTINEVLNSMRERGYISSQICNEEILADVFQGERTVRQVPPGHPLLHLLGVENEGEWNKLTPAQQQVVLFRVLTEGKHPFLRIATKLLHRWAEDSSTNSVSQERIVHSDEVLETIEAKTSEPHEYLSDAERLSQFYELAGIEMNTLTDGESSRVLDILHTLDTGYGFASKQGVSMQAYYGDRASSEKTQRQRLFKKLRDMRGKVR